MPHAVLDADCLVLPDRLLTPARLGIDADGRISSIESLNADPSGVREGVSFLAPGLIDLQVNGFAGIDLLSSDREAFVQLGRSLVRRGITGYLPTLISAPVDLLLERLETLAPWCEESADGATPLGLHLEGPFLSPDARGTHRSADLLEPDPVLMQEFLSAAGGRLRLVTLAPELPGAMSLIETLREQGIVVSLGHSCATFECCLQAVDHGASLVTHLGNAMGPLHQRSPGLSGAGLVDPRLSVGLIADLIHLHAGMLRLAWQAKGREGIVLVSDAMTAAGLPDGEYRFGDRMVQVQAGRCEDEEGRMAGASLDLFEGLQRFVATTQISLFAGVQLASSNPARHLGLGAERGRLQVGARADLIGVTQQSDGGLELDFVYLAGERIRQD